MSHIRKLTIVHFIGIFCISTKVVRDLGILISDDLKPRNQVVAAATRANLKLGKFKKTFQCRNLGLWKTLYTTYIRPHLEFAFQAWSPYLIDDINRLEQVQHRATKLITSIKHKPYEERLSILGITTLANRRVRGDLDQQFKITNGLDLIDFIISQKPASDAYNFRGHDKRLVPQIVVNCGQRRFFFTNRVPSSWNQLSQEDVNVTSINAFKQRMSLKGL